MYGIEEAITRMVGRKLAAVTLDKAGDRITFSFADGCAQVFGVEGDCCSRSWIEHVETMGAVEGATLLAVEDSSTIDATEDDALNPMQTRPPQWEGDTERQEREHDCLQVYRTTFKTDCGEIVLEYRNSSNGYYGGSLTDEGWQPAESDTP